jgi:hypothetical protein
MISIEGLDPALVLAGLYNAARPQGMGFLQYNPEPLTVAQATELLAHQKSFDYLAGRVMKLTIEDPLEPRLYDRDNGEGAALMVIASLRQTNDPNNPVIAALHRDGVASGAAACRAMMTPTTTQTEGGMVVISLGLDDLAEPLEAILHKLGQ